MSSTRLTCAIAASVLLITTLAACGADGPKATDTGPQDSGPILKGGGPGGTPPDASGEVAAVSGRTAQVQSPGGGQVAVVWNADTTFTEEVDAAVADVAVGDCVLVTSADDGADPEATEITAASARIDEPADDGGCRFGAGGPDSDGRRPQGAPSDAPSGAPDGVLRRVGTVGQVAAVTADGFTLSSQRPDDEDPVEVTVTVDGETAFTRTATAQAAAVEVGRCVVARGDSDDTGAVTATTISVSDPVEGACPGGGAA